MISHFIKHGTSGGPDTRAEEIRAARLWEKKLMADPEMQRRLLSGTDAELNKQFALYAVYAPAVHER
jgi:hypothetical protein